jgi:endonuclease/exonuclease/phosphatase (EEP) superfamily protein YafD
MRRLCVLIACALVNCATMPPPIVSAQRIELALTVLTWNVNWGVSAPETVAKHLRACDAEIVCLQETNADWQRELRARLGDCYPQQVFRESSGRMGGGLAFLSKRPGIEVAYVPSVTGWFDGWIMRFGAVQVLNVHLRPPVSESGNAITGYFTTNDERLDEIERFAGKLLPNVATIVCGDFNESPRGSAVRWLERRGFTNVLPLFDRTTPTWEWRVGPMTLRRRKDQVLILPSLKAVSASVDRVVASDHFPVKVELRCPGGRR